MKRSKPSPAKGSYTESDFLAEGAYADSILRTALGDHEGSIAALRRSLECKPTYAPAILSLGSVEYQLGKRAEGRELFRSLLSLPKDTPDLCAIIDEAGSFLIQIGAYKDGLSLYRSAVELFPAVAVLYQGIGCCAGHERRHEEAIAASARALQLEPDNQKFVNDLGWCLLEAGRIKEARSTLERAVSMDPSDELARENLRICKDRQKENSPSGCGNGEAVATTGRSITVDDLLGQPGLSQAAISRLVKAQPPTVLKAISIHGVGRKTAYRLLRLGLLTDPDGLQGRA
jgi:tetratricopeptide (TPR) repeat protein